MRQPGEVLHRLDEELRAARRVGPAVAQRERRVELVHAVAGHVHPRVAGQRDEGGGLPVRRDVQDHHRVGVRATAVRGGAQLVEFGLRSRRPAGGRRRPAGCSGSMPSTSFAGLFEAAITSTCFTPPDEAEVAVRGVSADDDEEEGEPEGRPADDALGAALPGARGAATGGSGRGRALGAVAAGAVAAGTVAARTAAVVVRAGRPAIGARREVERAAGREGVSAHAVAVAGCAATDAERAHLRRLGPREHRTRAGSRAPGDADRPGERARRPRWPARDRRGRRRGAHRGGGSSGVAHRNARGRDPAKHPANSVFLDEWSDFRHGLLRTGRDPVFVGDGLA